MAKLAFRLRSFQITQRCEEKGVQRSNTLHLNFMVPPLSEVGEQMQNLFFDREKEVVR